MIDIDPQVQPETEPEGYEFGYYTFDIIPTLEVSNVETPQDTSLNDNNINAPDSILLDLSVNNDSIIQITTEGYIL